MGLLTGVKVLDLTQLLAGPYCAQLLADLGADVIKVESPEGDISRTLPPFVNGESAYFRAMNRNKRGIVVDLTEPSGREALHRLIATADVLVENFRPGIPEKLGIDYETVKAINSRIIYCAISTFGETGPYAKRPGVDLLAQAMSGLIAVTGHANSPPVKVGTNICDFTCALLSCLAVMTGLFQRERTGEGIKADLSLLEGAMAAQAPMYAWYFGTGKTPPRMGTATPFTCPSESFDASDRPIVIAIPTNKFWKKLCHLTGLEELLEHPTMASNAGRVCIQPQIRSRLQVAFSKRTADEWLRLLIDAGIPAAPIYDYDEALADPQVKAREVTWQYDHPVAGQTRVIGNPLRFVGHPYPDPKPAPTLGEHTGEVLAEVGVQAGNDSEQLKR